MSKTAMIEISNEELFVFGKQISRHPTFPWLFSITDVYKACERPIKHQAVKYGKDPEKVFNSKRPGEWLRWNTEDEKIDAAAQRVRIRIKKYGAGCGFGKAKKSDASILASLTNREVCVHVVKGGSTVGKNKVVQGTYVCQDLIVSYAGFLNEKLRASVIDTFISVMNGYTKEVTKEVEKNERKAKGTPEREENIVLNNRLGEVAGRHGFQPRVLQGEINRSVLRMPKKEYMKKNKIGEPLNDNIPIKLLIQKNFAVGITTNKLFQTPVGDINLSQAKTIAYKSGKVARYIWQNLDRIETEAEDEED